MLGDISTDKIHEQPDRGESKKCYHPLHNKFKQEENERGKKCPS